MAACGRSTKGGPSVLISEDSPGRASAVDRLHRRDLLGRQPFELGSLLTRQLEPMLLRLLVHLDGGDTPKAHGLSVVACLQREGLLVLSIGGDDVMGDGCAVVVDSTASVESCVSGHLLEGPHCNTSA